MTEVHIHFTSCVPISMTRCCKMKTLRAYFSHGGLYGNMVRTINLEQEVGFDVDYDDAVFLPIDMRDIREAKYFVLPKSKGKGRCC